MPETTHPEIVWDGDIAVCADETTVVCDNPFDWEPLHMTDVPVDDAEDAA